jgi:putative ABC transport system substrate-binding protein
MRRREFMTLLGGAAATWRIATRAQQPKIPVVGFLNGGTPDGYAPYVAGFIHGLNETGYVENKKRHYELSVGPRVSTIGFNRWPPISYTLKWLSSP